MIATQTAAGVRICRAGVSAGWSLLEYRSGRLRSRQQPLFFELGTMSFWDGTDPPSFKEGAATVWRFGCQCSSLGDGTFKWNTCLSPKTELLLLGLCCSQDSRSSQSGSASLSPLSLALTHFVPPSTMRPSLWLWSHVDDGFTIRTSCTMRQSDRPLIFINKPSWLFCNSSRKWTKTRTQCMLLIGVVARLQN
jgi:hypothetical protein